MVKFPNSEAIAKIQKSFANKKNKHPFEVVNELLRLWNDNPSRK